MDLGLVGQVAVVTGAARGLGRAIAEAFAAEGARVGLIDRDEGVHRVAESLGGQVGRGFAVDVTEFADVCSAAEQFRRQFGRIDHVVHAAAIGSGKFGFPFWNLAPADWEPVLRVNILGAVHVAHAFAPEMARQHAGTLLFLASVAGQIGSQTDPPYSASKAALINFTQCAAKDLAPYGVRVNALCPGMVRTAMNQAVYDAWAATQPLEGRPGFEEWATAKIARLVPLNRWQEPADIAAMAVFLASDRARNITGQTINVDGGYVMHW
ncbi:MAG: 3-oxoacyl-ACP reductase [Isosphaeraceae bacterium]|nr:MAG: 3-oxoacyl-ACP reductase [Isosphaeraceae bacterium]